MAELIVDCEDENFESESFARCAGEGIDSDVPLAVEIVFTDGEGIRELNASARGKDAVTDVLSFPNLDGIKGMPLRGEEHPFDMDEEGRLFLGSVVICRERAAEQAEEYGHSEKRELVYLFVHSVCHLLGYDHMTDEDKKEMRAREEEIMSILDLERGE